MKKLNFLAFTLFFFIIPVAAMQEPTIRRLDEGDKFFLNTMSLLSKKHITVQEANQLIDQFNQKQPSEHPLCKFELVTSNGSQQKSKEN